MAPNVVVVRTEKLTDAVAERVPVTAAAPWRMPYGIAGRVQPTPVAIPRATDSATLRV